MLFRYFISGHSGSNDLDYKEWGIVGAASYTEAAAEVFKCYGEYLESETIYDFKIYELENPLSASELRAMTVDEEDKEYPGFLNDFDK